MKPQNISKSILATVAVLALALTYFATTHRVTALAPPPPPLPGAIFTTDSNCTGVDLNIYASKNDVYLDGGPAHPGAAGLPDGCYYVRVTDPSGATLLGTSIGSANDTPACVSGGEFVSCLQLSAILVRPGGGAGYDDTPNPGGEYKVWVSTVPTFDNDSTKTDNFKVKEEENPPTAQLHVRKFYDANTNGAKDPTEPFLDGWKVRIVDNIDYIRFTPVDIILDPDDYTVTEFDPAQTNWVHTTPTSVMVTLTANDNKTVTFGNVCLGQGGGKTLGFWSNKNGEAKLNDNGGMGPEFALLSGLCLRDASGGNFDPTTYTDFRTWLLNATAVNMAYMLSAQLAAMELNVEAGYVNGGSLVYAPGLLPFAPPGINSLGFISINDLMAAANAALCANGYTTAGSPDRAYQEALKNALDKANNNLNFVQPTPCSFSFQ